LRLVDIAVVDIKTENNGYVYIRRGLIFLDLHYPSLENENILHNNVLYWNSPDCTVMQNGSNTVQMITVFVLANVVSSGRRWIKLVLWNGQCEQS
jgi:hypothetical protein